MLILGLVNIFPPSTRMKLRYALSQRWLTQLPAYLLLLLLSTQSSVGQNLATWSFGVSGTGASPVAANATASTAAYTNAGASTTIANGRYNCSQWTNAALDLTRYLEVSVSPATNYNITVTQFTINAENNSISGATGPSNYEIRISTDGFSSFTALGTGLVTTTPTLITASVNSITRLPATVTVRVYFWGGNDAARLVRIGSAAFNGTVQTPTFMVLPVTLSGFLTTQGVPLATQTFTVSGTNLVGTNTATLAAPTGYEISTSSGSGFGSSLTITPTDGSFPSKTIYVRLTGATQGTFSGNILVSTPTGSGDNTVNIAVSGTVQVAQPVELIGFKGQAAGNSVVLTWATAQEQNADRFVVQRSSDASEFVSVGTRQSAGTTDRQQYYSLTDESPRNGLNYYRLQQIDRDGSAVYSKAIAVRVDASQPYASLLENPTDGQAIQLKLYQMDTPQVRLNTLAGQAIVGQLARIGATEAVFAPASPLSPGLYIITVQQGAIQQAMKVFVK